MNQRRFTPLPLLYELRRRLLKAQTPSLASVASRVVEVCASETVITPKAYFLENQLDRVTGVGFADGDWRGAMRGGEQARHSPTRALTLDDAWLIDGVLYCGSAVDHLSPRSQRYLLRLSTDVELDNAAIYCTHGGNSYFGVWLLDDCLSYLMAESLGQPVTTHQKPYAQAIQYEERVGMNPTRLQAAHFKRVTVFEDSGQNSHKRRRAAEFRRRLLKGVNADSHPGVFIVRGSTGQARVLENELELAAHFERSRGFRIIDPAREPVSRIISVCAGARTIVSIEGSQLAHGLTLLPEGGSLLVLQIPNRFGTLFKHATDRENQHFGFVVGKTTNRGFTVDADEIERTLDLMPQLP